MQKKKKKKVNKRYSNWGKNSGKIEKCLRSVGQHQAYHKCRGRRQRVGWEKKYLKKHGREWFKMTERH